jgi:hypothetical protein
MTNRLADAYDALAEAAAALAIELRAEAPQDAPQALPPLTPFEDTPAARSAEGGCPVHGLPWSVKEGGTRKDTGEPYKAFWKCGEQNDDGTYCRQFPSKAWVAAHPIR